MKNSESVYPYFNRLVEDIKVKINHNIECKKYSDPNTLLHIVLDRLEYLQSKLHSNPTISNVNFEKQINGICILAKNENVPIEGVILSVHFVENADESRFAKLNPIILVK